MAMCIKRLSRSQSLFLLLIIFPIYTLLFDNHLALLINQLSIISHINTSLYQFSTILRTRLDSIEPTMHPTKLLYITAAIFTLTNAESPTAEYGSKPLNHGNYESSYVDSDDFYSFSVEAARQPANFSFEPFGFPGCKPGTNQPILALKYIDKQLAESGFMSFKTNRTLADDESITFYKNRTVGEPFTDVYVNTIVQLAPKSQDECYDIASISENEEPAAVSHGFVFEN